LAVDTVGHRVATRDEWRLARDALLAREKEHTRRGDELARERQQLPWVLVEKDYRFVTDEGVRSLAELFDGRSQLLVYHFMFGPSYQTGCPVNSSIADSLDGVVTHLRARDATLILVSQAPIQKLQAYGQRMGWRIPWVSAADTDFNLDLGFSRTAEQARDSVAEVSLPFRSPIDAFPPVVESNARACGTSIAGYLTESPGFSTFVREGDDIYQAYQTSWRGLEFVMTYYPILDHAPKGRSEGKDDWQLWLRRHDEYTEG
jgi:predicted dithiol-disulfide oxidoreductase (DUF899 family)